MTGYYIGMAFGSLLLLLGAVVIFRIVIKNRDFKRMIKRIGQTAEKQINDDIAVWCKKTNNIFIPASLFKYNENKLFEVDGIIVTPKALIVVEIKSIKGSVQGDANLPVWKKTTDNQVYDLSNPIMQNDKHIEHIMTMIKAQVPTLSLIVYSNRTSNVEVVNTPSHVIVTRHANLFDILDEIELSLPVRIDQYDMKTIASGIKQYRTNKKSDIQAHKNIATQGRM